VKSLADRYSTALVTGASGGLGRAFSAMLRTEGVRVWGTARDPARLAPGEGFTPVALDLADPGSVERAFRTAEAAAGGLDLVINNAGFGLFGPFAERAFSEWRHQLDALLVGTLQLSHLALEALLARRRGALVNVSSLAAEFPLPFMSAYNVAKAGLVAFTESLMIEVAGTGVIVLDFRPGDYRTGFNHNMPTRAEDLPDADTPAGSRLRRIRAVLDAHLQAAPPPSRAAADLRRALGRGRSGSVRSGSWGQAWLAPMLARLAPRSWRRLVAARHFGVS
jgi:uncharacterized protein